MTAPIKTEFLLSHEAAQSEFLDSFKAGRPHHSWLIAGDKGIGKATLAYRIARYVFAQNSRGVLEGLNLGAEPAEPQPYAEIEDDGEAEDSLFAEMEEYAPPVSQANSLAEFDKSPLRISRSHPVFTRMAAGGISDFKVVEREYSDAAKTRLNAEITVDQVRALKDFFTTTAAEEGYKVAIIDSVDEMNANAKNALLKLLEEPPESALLLLVCHNMNGLLPTIKSRCRILRLFPIGDAAMGALLKEYLGAVPAADMERLAALSCGSVGRAVSIHAGGGLAIADAFHEAAAGIVSRGKARILDVVNLIGGREEGFEIFKHVFAKFVEDAIRRVSGLDVKYASASEKKAVEAFASRAGNVDAIFSLRAGAMADFMLVSDFNLDIAAAVISSFERLKNAR
jgi:DNA polymerase-3 subunit delta'